MDRGVIMEIKAGEYIRTTKGTIAKIKDEEFDLCISIPNRRVLYKKWVEDFLGSYTVREEVKKHSFNIIDLIEVGDYVNGIKIHSIKNGIGYGDNGQEGIIINKYYTNCKFIPTKEIKTIVTKEQFKAVEYEV